MQGSLIVFRKCVKTIDCTFFRLLCYTTEIHFRYVSVSLTKSFWAASLHMMEVDTCTVGGPPCLLCHFLNYLGFYFLLELLYMILLA